MIDRTCGLGESLFNERGGAFGFVCIWRKGGSVDARRGMSAGEFLTRSENQSGTWLIDGGWGGPPGPIHVQWDEESERWINGGHCGKNFGQNSPD